ncbi:hypothetical protein [Geodermatophilus normandii]|uniref:hypothetical protein n=1 Tax=Geodermatophilus normandii TaxID=1137989 RepID=UPI0011B5847B|nr:hypothetical protein [Geodermatophilus normandii]
MRLLLPAAALAALVLVGVAAALGADDLLAAGVVAVCVAGMGVAPALHLRTAGTATLLLASGAISCSVTVLVGLGMAWTGAWHPAAAFVVAGGISAAWLLAHLMRALRLRSAAVAGARQALQEVHRPAWVLAFVGLALTTTGAVHHAGEEPTPGGLLGVLGPIWFIGVVLTLAAALVATWARRSPALAVLLLVLPVVTAQAIVYQAPAVMVAARHVGVLEYVLANGSLEPSADIYQAWSGMFAGSAWLTAVGRIGDPLVTVAAFAPIMLQAGAVLAVRVLAGHLGLSRARAWWAGAVFGLGSTLSAVFFAPQSLAFLLAMTVVAFSVRAATASGRARAGLGLLVAVVSCAIAVTHQISPYLTVAALVALFAFRVVRSWWLPVVVLVPALAWAAVNFEQVSSYFSPSAVGNVVANVRPPSLSYNDFSESLTARLTYGLPALLLVLIGLLAVVSWWRRRDRRSWALLVTAASPGLLAFGSDYGQEVVFRVALFALPWLAIAVALLRLPRRSAPVGLALGAVVLVAVHTYGMTGMDYARVMRADEAAQLAQLERSAPDGAVLFSLGTGAATPYRLTEDYFRIQFGVLTYHGPTAELPAAPEDQAEADAVVGQLADVLQDTIDGPVYVDVSTAESGYTDLYGIQRAADFDRYARAFAGSDGWRAFSTGPTATIYELVR